VLGDDDEDEVTSVGGVNPTPVAGQRGFATMFREARGVFRLQIFKDAGNPISWQLKFRNPSANATMRLMWVVADTDPGSQQPWITVNAPSEVLLDARPGEQVTATMQVVNHGTGPLTISDAVGPTATPGLRISELPPPVAANSCAQVQLTFTGQEQPASRRFDWFVPSSDTTALTEIDDDLDEPPTHTGRVKLVVTSHPRMPRLNTGDIVVMDSNQMIRVDPATGLQTLVASGGRVRWEWDVAFEKSGNLLFTAHDSLVRMERESGSMHVVSRGGALQNARSMIITADGSVLVANSADGNITRVDSDTGAQSPVFTPNMDEGGVMAMAPDGTIYMAAGSTLVRIHLPTGTVTPILPMQGFGLEGVAVAPDGSVFLAGNTFFHEQHALVRLDPVSGAATTIFNQPDILLRRVHVTPSGTVLVTATPFPNPDPFEGLILRLSPTGGGGQWDTTPVSVGGLMRSGTGLVVVPPTSP
jgi:streptogramin lyase